MIVRTRRSRKLERWRSMTIFGNNGLRVVSAFLVCWSGCFLQHAAAQTNSADLAALQDLAKAWNGVSATSPWVGSDPCGSNWIGVVCDDNGAVIQLNLANMNLSGTIPAAVGDLSNLEVLELSSNPELGGSLPKELGKLVKLKSLNIQRCAITGPLPPELSNLIKLEFLAVNSNKITGSIPHQIGRLSNLYWFDISQNQIGDVLPISTDNEDGVGLDTLFGIKHFHFNNNTLQGRIPPAIFTLPLLIHLLLDSNNFIGEIPGNITESTIMIMRLDNNQLKGPIPDSWGQLVNLTEIHVSNNQLDGTIPDLSQLQSLRLLDTSNNQFSPQPIPDFLVKSGGTVMNSLQTLSMRSSNLVGSIPPAIFNNQALQKIDLSNNGLNGTLTFGQIGPLLEYVDLEGNAIESLTGTPVQNGKQVEIKTLLLKDNPVCNSTLNRADEFCVDDTGSSAFYSLSSICPARTCSNGKVLRGGSCSCGNALICNMMLNSPPFQILNQNNMDRLAKDIADMFSEANIIKFNLDRVKGQVTLDKDQLWVDRANLIERSRIEFSLAVFPPSGRDWTREEVAYIVFFLNNNTVHLPPQQGPYSFLGSIDPIMGVSSSSSLSTAALAGIIAGGAVVLIILVLICFYALRQKKRAERAEVLTRPFASWGSGGGRDNGAAPKLKGARYFPVSELKKATNNFSERNEIGSGGYGKVYRGVLTDGDVVAVKRAQEGSMQGKDEFRTEIELLSRVHHRNLVGLIGFCYERDQREQMLIYEFMANGTLRDHLVGKTGEALTWQNRLNIALGSAKGLSYLHELANPPIIHRDIKSTNILLDERLTAKVADFGLSKLAPDDDGGKDHVSTQVKGTLGYLDPEYYMTQQLTEKSDVYSFGVVLLELLTARAPIEKGKYIVREVRTALDKGGIAALRPMLDRHIKDCPSNELEDFLGLALQCVEEAAKNRPTMNEVVKELDRICGHSFSSSVVVSAGGPEGRPAKDPYNDETLLSKETQFQYSGGFTVPTEVQPK